MGTKPATGKTGARPAKEEYMDDGAPKRSSRSKRRFPRHQIDVRMLVHIFRAGVTTTIWGRSTMIGKEGIGGTLTGDLEMGLLGAAAQGAGGEVGVRSPAPVGRRAVARSGAAPSGRG